MDNENEVSEAGDSSIVDFRFSNHPWKALYLDVYAACLDARALKTRMQHINSKEIASCYLCIHNAGLHNTNVHNAARDDVSRKNSSRDNFTKDNSSRDNFTKDNLEAMTYPKQVSGMQNLCSLLSEVLCVELAHCREYTFEFRVTHPNIGSECYADFLICLAQLPIYNHSYHRIRVSMSLGIYLDLHKTYRQVLDNTECEIDLGITIDNIACLQDLETQFEMLHSKKSSAQAEANIETSDHGRSNIDTDIVGYRLPPHVSFCWNLEGEQLEFARAHVSKILLCYDIAAYQYWHYARDGYQSIYLRSIYAMQSYLGLTVGTAEGNIEISAEGKVAGTSAVCIDTLAAFTDTNTETEIDTNTETETVSPYTAGAVRNDSLSTQTSPHVRVPDEESTAVTWISACPSGGSDFDGIYTRSCMGTCEVDILATDFSLSECIAWEEFSCEDELQLRLMQADPSEILVLDENFLQRWQAECGKTSNFLADYLDAEDYIPLAPLAKKDVAMRLYYEKFLKDMCIAIEEVWIHKTTATNFASKLF